MIREVSISPVLVLSAPRDTSSTAAHRSRSMAIENNGVRYAGIIAHTWGTTRPRRVSSEMARDGSA